MCAGKLACAKSSSTEYGAYSWAICGWSWNSGLGLTVASWAIAAEAKMSIDPAARANCKDFRIVFLRRFLFTHRRIAAKVVMRGLDPRIHLLRKKTVAKRMDCRVKPGNDSLNRSVAVILLERGRLRCEQQRVAGVHQAGARVRFTRQGHEFLGEFVPTLPRVDLRKRDELRRGVRLGAELVGAHRCQRRDDRELRALLCHLVGGAADRPAAPVEADEHRCDRTDGCALQQTRHRFSLQD